MIPGPFRKPDWAAYFRGVEDLNIPKPHLYAKTFEIYGVTAEEVQAAIDAEQADRNALVILRVRPEVKADD